MLTAEDSSGGSSGSDDIGSNGVDQGPVSNQINSGSIHGFTISVKSSDEILSLGLSDVSSKIFKELKLRGNDFESGYSSRTAC